MTVQSDALPVQSPSPTVHHGQTGTGVRTISAALRDSPLYRQHSSGRTSYVSIEDTNMSGTDVLTDGEIRERLLDLGERPEAVGLHTGHAVS